MKNLKNSRHMSLKSSQCIYRKYALWSVNLEISTRVGLKNSRPNFVYYLNVLMNGTSFIVKSLVSILLWIKNTT